jgi:hypothetical protein
MLLGFVGNAGNAIMFVSLLVGEAIIGLWVLMYAAHCFLVVVEDTSAGNDAVYWPDEPLTDYFWKLFYLAWLGAIWLIVPWLVLRLAAPTFLTDHLGESAMLAGAALWLLFPIGLLSSLGASSVWIVFRPGVPIRMVRRIVPVAGIYGISAALLAGCSALVYFALEGAEPWLVPVAALAASVTLLIYARLMGRLAWLLQPPEPREPKGAKRPRQTADGEPARRSPALDQTPSPYVVDQPAEGSEPVDGYGLKSEDQPALPRSVPIFEEEAEESEEQTGPSLARIEAARERRAIDAPPPPRWPLLSGIYTFPWYLTSLKAWIALSLGFLLITAGGRALLHWWQ